MKYRIALLVLILCGTLNISSALKSESSAEKNAVSSYYNCGDGEYTYQHIWINGVRWMYVYNCEGSIINAYPDPED